MNRRQFLGGLLGAATTLKTATLARAQDGSSPPATPGRDWAVIATWAHGLPAVQRASAMLAAGDSALDAVQHGVMVSEDDPDVSSVGKGGLPNAAGEVELDAAIMRGSDLAVGAVAGLKGIRNPVAVARKVLDETPHVLLVGDGALRFAREQGFKEEDLLTPAAKARWQQWRTKARRSPPSHDEPRDQEPSHDTIGMVGLDATGSLASACTTSGLAWKLPGRVGDSPIVGAGLYADGTVGGAAATGVGEEVLRVAGCFLVVEGMRRGLHPREAIHEALRRILRNPPRGPAAHRRQVGFVALRRDGAVAAAALRKGFRYVVGKADGEVALLEAEAIG